MNEIIIRYFYCETKEGEILSSMVSKCLKDFEGDLANTFTIHSQLSQRDATLKICPISIEPRADLPSDMKEVYNFEVI